jgi:Protein of unknown function (DUF4239)
MDFYWVYDIPNWLFFLISTAFFIAFAVFGLLTVGNKLEKKLKLTYHNNEAIAAFLGLSGVFYGITLGLIAVGTFDNFNQTYGIVNEEASALAALYTDISILEKPEKEKLMSTLRAYTKNVIEVEWQQQKIGITPNDNKNIFEDFKTIWFNYNPESVKDKIIYGEVLDQYNKLIEKRNLRLNAVTTCLPATIWGVLFLGAFINIVMTWLLVIKNRKLDILINTLVGLLLGTLIFLIASMDNAFRGEYCVSSDAFQLLLDGIMK